MALSNTSNSRQPETTKNGGPGMSVCPSAPVPRTLNMLSLRTLTALTRLLRTRKGGKRLLKVSHGVEVFRVHALRLALGGIDGKALPLLCLPRPLAPHYFVSLPPHDRPCPTSMMYLQTEMPSSLCTWLRHSRSYITKARAVGKCSLRTN